MRNNLRCFEFGAFAEPLAVQLKETDIPGGKIAMFQSMADGLTLCWVQGVITDGEHDKALNRLTDQIAKAIREGRK